MKISVNRISKFREASATLDVFTEKLRAGGTVDRSEIVKAAFAAKIIHDFAAELGEVDVSVRS